MSDDEVESILLHVTRLAPVGGLQDLHYVLHRYISLQVGLAKHLMTLQGLKGVRLYAELSTDIHNFQIFFELHVDVSEKSFQDHS